MQLDDVSISKSIIEAYKAKLLANLDVDVALGGCGSRQYGGRLLLRQSWVQDGYF